MKNDTRLHHCSQNIATGTLGNVIEMYKMLGCEISYKLQDISNWAMVAQNGLSFDIQIVEVDDTPVSDINLKRKTHIAFISNNPSQVIKNVKTWAEGKDVKFREGGWSDKERYFDLPDIFINSVIEIMHSSVEEQ